MNKRDEYGWLAIFLHWLLFLLVAGMVGSGKYSASLDDKNLQVLITHKQVGIAVFLLMAFRFLWKIINSGPDSLSDSGIAKFVAMIVHLSLYLIVLGQALSGVVMSQLFGNEVAFFGIEVPLMFGNGGLIGAIPESWGGAKEAAVMMRGWHGTGGTIIIALVGLHILGGVYHHFIGMDTLRRMWFGYKPRYARESRIQ